jgi:beta-N-acetylhexosaminidase
MFNFFIFLFSYFFIFFSEFDCLAREATLEEKIGQMLIVHFNGSTINQNARQLIQEAHVGGFIYFRWANELDNPGQVKKLSLDLQELAKASGNIPLWICIDQEYGPVNRFNNGFTPFPGSRAFANHNRPNLAKQWAQAIGKELLEVGINVNFAPVIDVSSHPETSYMTQRCFGDTPEVVISFAKPTLEGFAQAAILAVPKHYPGYGDTAIDPHEDLPWLYKSLEELEKVDLQPFIQLSSYADAFMTAHIMVPAFDSHYCATLSKNVIHEYLRQKINFQGLIFTDSLAMQGLLNNAQSIEEAAILAIQAGCDILILGGKQINSSQQGFEFSVLDNLRICKAIKQAVENGRLSIETINSAFNRILHFKKKYGLLLACQDPPRAIP